MPYPHFKHTELTRRIIGSAMKVHGYLGPGYPEIIYRRCLAIELEKAGLKYACEVTRDIYYGGLWVGSRRLDLLIDNVVFAELKATTEIKNADYNQVFNLLKVFDLEVALLLNFGKPSLEFKRFANSKIAG